jgi:hypothetical protein
MIKASWLMAKGAVAKNPFREDLKHYSKESIVRIRR